MEGDYKKFKSWREEQKDITWNFKEQMAMYCEADVALLAKAILKLRKIFKDKLDVDPWRYSTIASLCMDIYKCKFMFEKSIVANEDDKESSIQCKGWPGLCILITVTYSPR